ncbi:MAG: hypothetical protein EXR12_07920 [Rhodospirillaceae bacterium]|nr:hypothetical protein [Rhodospirillaceae bacterium]
MAVSLGFFSLPVSAQHQIETRNTSYDHTIGGVQFRVPGSYMHPSHIRGRADGALFFMFWVSDGKPEAAGVTPIGTKDRVGRAIFWPTEPGRPFNSGEDFLVRVRAARPMERDKALERQQFTRDGVTRGGGPTTNENGLECHTYATGYKYCATPIGTDPDVAMALQLFPENLFWRMRLYSPADSLWAELDFPELGQAHWPEVVCRTLLLIRTWRISDGPPPPDCSKRPRLS